MFKMTPEQQAAFNALTALQRLVVIEHLAGHAHDKVWKNCRPESKMTGAAAISRVRNILANPSVSKLIKLLQMEKVSELVMDRQEALERLTNVARGNMADLVEFATVQVGVDQSDRPVYQAVWVFKDSALMDPKTMQTIAELACNKDGFKVKQHSPLAAIKQLAEMQAWNKEAKIKVDHTSSDGSMTPKDTTIDATKLSTNTLKELLKARDGQC